MGSILGFFRCGNNNREQLVLENTKLNEENNKIRDQIKELQMRLDKFISENERLKKENDEYKDIYERLKKLI